MKGFGHLVISGRHGALRGSVDGEPLVAVADSRSVRVTRGYATSAVPWRSGFLRSLERRFFKFCIERGLHSGDLFQKMCILYM